MCGRLEASRGSQAGSRGSRCRLQLPSRCVPERVPVDRHFRERRRRQRRQVRVERVRRVVAPNRHPRVQHEVVRGRGANVAFGRGVGHGIHSVARVRRVRPRAAGRWALGLVPQLEAPA